MAALLLCLIFLSRFFGLISGRGTRFQAPIGLLGGDTHDGFGAVASESEICSKLGIHLLKAGGNAADALVGTVFCIGVVDCHHSGIGGGGFALARSSQGAYESIDFRESAPEYAYEDMFKDNVEGSLRGGLASAVPGEVRGLYHIWSHYGALAWEELLQPAIILARDGFTVSEDFAQAMDRATRLNDFLSNDPSWAEDFAPQGSRLRAGDIMTRKRYGRTLAQIARNPQSFYTGGIADTLIKALQDRNGTMQREDLEDYKVLSRKPLSVKYKGFHIHSLGVPASGAVTLSIMKILEAYNGSIDDIDPALLTHRMDEATRFGYGKRASFGDPDFVDGLARLELDMLSHEYAVDIKNKISDDHTLNVSAYDPKGFEIIGDHGTSHVVTADISGMAFSLTTTINLFFGSRIMVPETGIILNNEMNDFSIPNVSNAFGYFPNPANYARPSKRALSSISPIIIEHPNHTLYSVIGASGGSRIIPSTVQNLHHILDKNMTVHEALARPRFHDQLIPNHVLFDVAYDEDIVQTMKDKGHNITRGLVGSSVQGLRLVNGHFEAAAEPKQHDSAGLTT